MKAREALIALLESDALTKPTTIAEAPDVPGDDAGAVTSNIRHGELFLHPKGKPGQRIRLRWEPEGDLRRELPAGTYVLTGYRHVARDGDGIEWIWSTTSPGYREFEVAAGDEPSPIDVRVTLGVRARAFRAKDQYRVALAFQAEDKLGHTLYRDGTRIDIRWQCLDAEGTVLLEGEMEYG